MSPNNVYLSQPKFLPVSPLKNNMYPAEKLFSNDTSTEEFSIAAAHVDAGRLDEHFYDNTLSWWRLGIRHVLVDEVEKESDVIAAMQKRLRTPWLDTFFVYTSSLGTHTFFLTSIPMFFFFGYHDLGRGLLLILAFGVYISSFIKDLCCSPRPFMPPVVRLTFSNHHLEYGFPSTHSTNSVSIALYFFVHLLRLYKDSFISAASFAFAIVVLFIYTASIVFGRIYTGMHSFTDCTMGVLLGAGTWALHYFFMDAVDTWVITEGWIVPLTTIPICLLMVNQHPQPIDDCPCFEDAIAFVSVGMGLIVGRWYTFRIGYGSEFFVTDQPGSSYDTWSNVSVWWIFAVVKMTVGILIIFSWRLVVKSVLHSTLPPTFRFLSSIFTLPSRRFYTPATDYTTVPSGDGLHPIPSVIDLPSQLELEMDEDISASTGRASRSNVGALLGRSDVKNRKGSNGNKHVRIGSKSEIMVEGGGMQEDTENVKHYDADVLTKVVVYAGIGLLATIGVPIFFELIGWGAKLPDY